MRAGIALGSNVGDRLRHLCAARKAIGEFAATPILASPIYETEPVDCEAGAENFWNAAIEIGFEGDAALLLQKLQAIEESLGRPVDHPRNVSREIDLDLLYAGDARIESAALALPHPRMTERQFVLQPLADIRPELILPGQSQSVRELLARKKGSAKVVALPEQWT